MTPVPLPSEEIERLKELAAAAFKDTPLPWNQDTEDSSWSHGIGDDVVEGCKTYAMFDGLGRRIFGSENSTAGEVHEESDEEGHYAWDDIGRRHFTFLEKLIELYPRMAAEIEAGRAGTERVRELEVALRLAANRLDIVGGFGIVGGSPVIAKEWSKEALGVLTASCSVDPELVGRVYDKLKQNPGEDPYDDAALRQAAQPAGRVEAVDRSICKDCGAKWHGRGCGRVPNPASPAPSGAGDGGGDA